MTGSIHEQLVMNSNYATQAQVATNANKTATSGSSTSVSSQQFLHLLTEQLKYQDPMNPMDNSEMLAQEAQFVCFHVADASGFIGLIFYWLFSQCVYVEHLAIAETRRQHGWGRRVLALAQQHGLPVILEIEPVCDAGTARRCAFYERCGYHRLPYKHFQLPYRCSESPLQLELLSYPTAADAALLAVFQRYYAAYPMRYRET